MQAPCTIVSCVGKIARFFDVSSGSSTFMHMSEPDIMSCSAVSISSSGKYATIIQSIRHAAGSAGHSVASVQVPAISVTQVLAPTIF